MSESRVRYFQGRKSGHVFRAADENVGLTYSGNPALAEVQVVPVDAIVIRRDELPEVLPAGGSTWTVGGETVHAGAPDDLRRHGLAALALDLHLREHPPVDAGQVMALADALEAEWFPDDPDRATVLARRLVVRGVRVEAKS